jgi:hypothetical protein
LNSKYYTISLDLVSGSPTCDVKKSHWLQSERN